MLPNQKTTLAKEDKNKTTWWLIDLDGKILGRVATQVADILRGKHKPTYTPNLDAGDFVVAINADKIKLTGKKWGDKLYYRHSGFPGGLKKQSATEMLEKHPDALLTKAVQGMLPKNDLSRQLILKLKVYAGKDHPHTAQNPKPWKWN